MGSGKLIRRAIDKHGVDNFTKEVLHVFDNEVEMNLKEKEFVTEEFCLRKDTYNLCPGGRGGFGYINRMGISSRPKPATKRFFQDKELVKKRSEKCRETFNRDKERFEEWHHRSTMTKKRLFNEGTLKGSFTGMKHSDKTKKKISDVMKGIVVGLKNSQFGTIWITNGSMNKKIKSIDLDDWSERGYKRGRRRINW